MPWLMDLQFTIEKNIHKETFDDVPSPVFQIELGEWAEYPSSMGENGEFC